MTFWEKVAIISGTLALIKVGYSHWDQYNTEKDSELLRKVSDVVFKLEQGEDFENELRELSAIVDSKRDCNFIIEFLGTLASVRESKHQSKDIPNNIIAYLEQCRSN